jgi:hypothetical protein
VGPDGRTYYLDHINKRTTWEDPRKAPVITAANAVQRVNSTTLKVASFIGKTPNSKLLSSRSMCITMFLILPSNTYSLVSPNAVASM